jgi:hypothetical protein
MNIGKYKVSEVRKMLVAGIGTFTLLANEFVAEFTDLIPDSAEGKLSVAIGAVTTLGVFLVKNAEPIDALDEGLKRGLS